MHLFLSPHLDDAVLSCGGMIHRLVRQGAPVSIMTVMAGDPPHDLPDTPIVRDLHERWRAGENPVAARRWEDIEASRVLEARIEHRDYRDCVYRTHKGRALYPDEESLFGEVHPDDDLPRALNIEADMFTAVHPNLEAIYVPLGVGHHVDHQIIRDWGLTIHQHAPQLALKFYEEYPYTRERSAVRDAFNTLTGIECTAETQILTGGDIAAKIRAIACHRSQINTFWESLAAMEYDVRETFSIGDGMYAERYWSLKARSQHGGSNQ